MKQKMRRLLQCAGLVVAVGFVLCTALRARAEEKVVTPDTFEQVFDIDSENLIATVKQDAGADKIIFQGDFSDALAGKVNCIVADCGVSFEGQDAVLTDVYFSITADNVSVSGFKITNTSVPYAVCVKNGSGVSVTNNEIQLTTDEEHDGYAIYADCPSGFCVKENRIKYTGNTNGDAVNNAVYVSGNTGISGVEVSNNTMEITLPSCYVTWRETIPGSGSWESFKLSEGVVFDNCHGLVFEKNVINVGYNKVVGAYDVIDGVRIKGDLISETETDVRVADNQIFVSGNNYVYSFLIYQSNYEVTGNSISAESNYYSNAVMISDGSLSGRMDDNTISAKASTEEDRLAVALYFEVLDNYLKNTTISNNVISAEARCGFGIQSGSTKLLSGETLKIKDNSIRAYGNYEAGIALAGSGTFEITGNTISSTGNAEGECVIWDSFLTKLKKTYGIGILEEGEGCNAVISDNTIESTDLGVVSWASSSVTGNNINVRGEYTVDVYRENKPQTRASVVTDNILFAKEKAGDASVYYTDVDTVSNNTGRLVTDIFEDVIKDKWYVKGIQYVYDKGLMTGKGPSPKKKGLEIFGTNQSMTRAELVVVLYAMEGKPETEYKGIFDDVPAGSWYAQATQWAYDQGIVKGKGKGKFAPSSPIMREEFATMLCAYLKSKGVDTNADENILEEFGDQDKISSWARKSIAYAAKAGIISGTATNPPKINPKNNLTRAEAASMVMRTMEILEAK